jgi:hypothetical protein
VRGDAPGAALVLAALFAGARPSPAGTEVRLFRGAHEREISLTSYRRGIFFGSCGPATKSLRWEYSFTLKGDGPVYRAAGIEIKDGALQPVGVRWGSIALTERTIRIDLAIDGKGRTVPFPYNGEYRIRP